MTRASSPRTAPVAADALAAALECTAVFRFLHYRPALSQILEQRSLRQRDLADWVGRAEAWVSRMLHANPGQQADFSLTDDMARVVAQHLDLTRDETTHLLAMVAWDTTEPADKAVAFGHLMEFYQPADTALGPDSLGAWFRAQPWYVLAIFELARAADVSLEPAAVSARFALDVTPEQAAEALRLLQASDLLPLDESMDRHLELAMQPAAAGWHRSALELLGQTLRDAPQLVGTAAQGNIQTSYEVIRVPAADETWRRLDAFVHSVAEFARQEPHPDRVLQVGTVLTPLSRMQGALDTPVDLPDDRPRLSQLAHNPYGQTWQDFVREHARRRGLNQRQLAEASGTTPYKLSRLLSYRVDLHAARDRVPLVEGLVRALALDHDDETLFRALVDAESPSRSRTVETASSSRSRSPLDETSTGSRTYGIAGWASSASATAPATGALASIPDLIASGRRSSSTTSICSRTNEGASTWTPCTARVS